MNNNSSSKWIKCIWLNPELPTIKESPYSKISRKRKAWDYEIQETKGAHNQRHSKDSNNTTNYGDSAKPRDSTKLIKTIKRFEKKDYWELAKFNFMIF